MKKKIINKIVQPDYQGMRIDKFLQIEYKLRFNNLFSGNSITLFI